ncbi:uncharacterized protein [Rutidosis leptorrhynchoides]|uniref:uncharacterized protein n=1 Tax=Rutidosis leptorrhynchoides TaxID=125765 RepID=UPI003A9A037B
MSSDLTKLQPINHILHSVPIKLELNDSQYNTWSELFKIHCKAHDVLAHLTSETIPASSSSKAVEITQEVWERHDAIVLQWLYATISKELLRTIMEPDLTAMKAWNRLKSLFHDNKHTQALALMNQFINFKLDNFPNVSAYYEAIKNLADELADVDSKVSIENLVLQLVAGLNENYSNIATNINQMEKLLPFYDAKLILEETMKTRQAAMNHSATNSALISTTDLKENPNPSPLQRDGINYSRPLNGRGRGHNGSRGGRNNGRGRGG